MKISSFKQFSFRRAILPASIIAAMALSGSANAFPIDTGNDDFAMRWDNTFRYNAGWRMSDKKWDLKSEESNAKFKNGGMITNRLDILSEFDFIWKKDSGFRVSAAGWYDKRYDGDYLGSYAYSSMGGKYPDEVKRYYNGPSGEILDAFVFTKFDLGDVPVNVKLGQHTIYWGETIFSLADGVSAGQSYADLRKALATPGAEAKEIFKPLPQFSFSAQISPDFTVMGQYFFSFKPDLFPLGGTYFSPAEFLTYQGQTNVAPLCALSGTCGTGGSFAPAIVWDGVHYNGLDRNGDWGLAARWRPEWLDGTAGFYYREYTAKDGGALAINVGGLGGSFLSGGATPAVAGIWLDPDAPRTKLYGFSLAKQVWGISWGMDLTYRKDATLMTDPFSIINGNALLAAPPPGGLGQSGGNGLTGWAPIGDIYTGTFNMIAYDGKRGIGDFNLYDSAVLTAELNWDGLDKVTKNPQNFGGRANCTGGTSPLNSNSPATNYYGCATGSSYGISFLFEPKWFQVWAGTDVTMPIFYTVGLHGNSAVPAVGSNEGMGAYSIGVTADVDAKYNFALKYNGNLYKRHMTPGGTPKTNAALGDFSDRNWLSFTAKATW